MHRECTKIREQRKYCPILKIRMNFYLFLSLPYQFTEENQE